MTPIQRNAVENDFQILIKSNFINIYHISHIYPTPPLGQDMTQGQFF